MPLWEMLCNVAAGEETGEDEGLLGAANAVMRRRGIACRILGNLMSVERGGIAVHGMQISADAAMSVLRDAKLAGEGKEASGAVRGACWSIEGVLRCGGGIGDDDRGLVLDILGEDEVDLRGELVRLGDVVTRRGGDWNRGGQERGGEGEGQGKSANMGIESTTMGGQGMEDAVTPGEGVNKVDDDIDDYDDGVPMVLGADDDYVDSPTPVPNEAATQSKSSASPPLRGPVKQPLSELVRQISAALHAKGECTCAPRGCLQGRAIAAAGLRTWSLAKAGGRGLAVVREGGLSGLVEGLKCVDCGEQGLQLAAECARALSTVVERGGGREAARQIVALGAVPLLAEASLIGGVAVLAEAVRCARTLCTSDPSARLATSRLPGQLLVKFLAPALSHHDNSDLLRDGLRLLAYLSPPLPPALLEALSASPSLPKFPSLSLPLLLSSLRAGAPPPPNAKRTVGAAVASLMASGPSEEEVMSALSCWAAVAAPAAGNQKVERQGDDDDDSAVWDASFACGVPKGVLTAAALGVRLGAWDLQTASLRAARALVGMPRSAGVEGLCEVSGWDGGAQAVLQPGCIEAMIRSLGRGGGERDVGVCNAARALCCEARSIAKWSNKRGRGECRTSVDAAREKEEKEIAAREERRKQRDARERNQRIKQTQTDRLRECIALACDTSLPLAERLGYADEAANASSTLWILAGVDAASRAIACAVAVIDGSGFGAEGMLAMASAAASSGVLDKHSSPGNQGRPTMEGSNCSLSTVDRHRWGVAEACRWLLDYLSLASYSISCLVPLSFKQSRFPPHQQKN